MENRENYRVMNNLGKISKSKLLRVFNHNSIDDAVKYYSNIDKPKFSKNAHDIAYKIMQKEYNNVVKTIREEEKLKKTRNQKSY